VIAESERTAQRWPWPKSDRKFTRIMRINVLAVAELKRRSIPVSTRSITTTHVSMGENSGGGKRVMRSAFRLITIFCVGFLFTCGAEAQQRSKPRRPVQSTDQSKTTPLQVQYLTSERPRPVPLSDAVRVGHMLYLSGQLGTDGASGLVTGGIKAETKQAMENMRRVLERNGSSLDQVVKCTVMLTDISERAAMSEVYVTYFAKDRLPARSAFGVNGLALGARVEIECLATVK